MDLSEGYHLYDFQDELNIVETKYLYMRQVLKETLNPKGKSDSLMIQSRTKIR
jgi:hypothetical protein